MSAAAAGASAALARAVAVELERHGQPFRAPAGTTLFSPGDPCPGYILLDAGRIRVAIVSASGREATLYRVGPGELCVQTFQCLAGLERYTAYGTVEQAIAGRLLSQAAFEQRLALSETFRRFLMTQVAARFESLAHAVERTAFTSLPARLAAILLDRAEGDCVPLTHAALAAEIGSAREAVSRQLERFAKDELVATERHRLRLLAPARLRRVAEGDI